MGAQLAGHASHPQRAALDQGAQLAAKAVQREAHDVEEAALDAHHKAAGLALDACARREGEREGQGGASS